MAASDQNLLTAARRLQDLVDELPDRVRRVVEDLLDDTRDALDDLETKMREAYDAKRPRELHALPRWHAERPSFDEHAAAWWVRIGGGPAALASDGHGALFVDEVPDAPASSPRMTAEKAATLAHKVVEGHSRVATTITTNELARVIHVADTGSVGGVHAIAAGAAFIDSALVRRWALTAAEVNGDAEITVGTSSDARVGVTFSGRGWRAIVMPKLLLDDERSELLARGAVIATPEGSHA